jgi:hypothetical protein
MEWWCDCQVTYFNPPFINGDECRVRSPNAPLKGVIGDHPLSRTTQSSGLSMNLILNYLEFWTNHAPHVVHGMVHGKIVSIQNPFVFIEGVEVKSYHNAISSFRSAR